MTHSTWSRWKGLFRQRCPRCLQGRIFQNLFETHKKCPQCGLSFEREQGYFLGAMYFSYALSIGIMGAMIGIGVLLFPDASLNLIITVCGVLFLPLVPIAFRYSRVIWIYFDRWASP